ncbi:TrbL/VirB6 family protein [Wolbachia endosymbiont of Pentidionis agamae]|uniref:type IV secretion system protein n=1 Tax=Wolbachia endosymbiont of Pentidionis agamae TaxID=3110435 RepID=UPI002FD50CA8
MIINKGILLLILCFIVTSCDIDCVEPGLKAKNTSVSIDIPIGIEQVSEIYWTNSKQVINSGEKVRFKVDGSINFCPADTTNPKEVLVPAVFCADGSVPDYSKAKNIQDAPDNYGLDAQEVCGPQGFGNSNSYSYRRYVDTGIKVNSGDTLSFSLVPREVTINCDNPKNLKLFSFDNNCYRNQNTDDINKVTASDLCKGGKFYCGNKDNKREEKIFNSLESSKIGEERKQQILVGNGYTPYDNKVSFDFNSIKVQEEIPWTIGKLSDLRKFQRGLDKSCDKKWTVGDDLNTWMDKCGRKKIKKYSSYELNCYFQRICYNKEGIWHDGLAREHCISSIRYQKYENGNTCNPYHYLRRVESWIENCSVEPKCDAVDIENNDLKNNASWAEALIAKIGDSDATNKMNHNSKGLQCLPKKKGANDNMKCSRKTDDDFKKYSSELSKDYTVDKVTPGSNVMLAIADNKNFYRNRGGYHVKVTRSCTKINGEKLYMYLGDSPPQNLQSQDIKEVIQLSTEKFNGDDYYVMDGTNIPEGEYKEIYFGIDVRNVKKEDLIPEKNDPQGPNSYTVNLFFKKRLNNFVSQNINKIFTEFKEIFKSESKYKKHATNLLQTVRAVLILYIIFSVIAYMLGTAQLSKFDLVIRIVKIAVIAVVFSNQSWDFLGKNLSLLFIDSSSYLIDSFSGYIGSGNTRFVFLDLTVGVLFSGDTWLKFLSLMLAGPFGFIAFLTILFATFVFLKCILSALMKYVIVLMVGAFLISLTPLFIVFILFQVTRGLFDGWIKALAHIAVQPIILLSMLSILNQLMYSILYNITNFTACYQCLISMKAFGADVCLLKAMLPLGYNPGITTESAIRSGQTSNSVYFGGLPIDLVQTFIYLIIAYAMSGLVNVSETMAQAILSSGYGVSGAVSHAAHYASQAALSTVGLDDRTQQMINNIRRSSHTDKVIMEIQNKKQSDDKTKNTDDKKSEDKTDKKQKEKTNEKSSKTEASSERIIPTNSSTDIDERNKNLRSDSDDSSKAD